MPKPLEGDWLSENEESGQSFLEFVESNPPRPQDNRRVLYVQPVDSFHNTNSELLANTCEMLSIFFRLPVQILPELSLEHLPEGARRIHMGSPQVDSISILRLLAQHKPADAVAVLALTASDLWPNVKGHSFNFVFGQASPHKGTGVWSTARFGDEPTIALQRTLKTAVHETGHMLGINHCTHYACGMNGCNHLEENDRRPFGFCMECEMKVWWACDIENVGARYTKLAALMEKLGLPGDAAWYRQCLEAVTVSGEKRS